jgi:AhpD family alkylhydroperoxidase
MSELDPRVRELVALGTAYGVNCQTCLEVHKQAAQAAGLSAEEMQQAIRVAEAIVSGARGLTRRRTGTLFGKADADASCCAQAAECGRNKRERGA